MKLTCDDIATLSRYLDEVEGAAPSHVQALLAGLPAAQSHLRPALHRLLTESIDAAELADMPVTEAPKAGDAPGDRVGPYRLLRRIGEGGMATVWLAERADGAFERRVALKLPHARQTAGLAQRMARERSIAAVAPSVSPTAPGLARLRALAGSCALASGDRRAAAEAARLSKEGFERQPEVSPWYRLPLTALERGLGSANRDPR